jgi:hypothetical protein
MVLVQSDLTKRVSTTIGLVLVTALVFSTAAFAQDSSVQTYGGGGGFTGQVDDPGAGVAAGGSAGGSAEAADPGSLPFTGLDLGLAVGGGLLLLALGALVARMVPRAADHRS